MGLTSPASALNQRVLELTHHLILIAEHVPLPFPPLMFSFPISPSNGLILQMPSAPCSPLQSHTSLPTTSPSTHTKRVPLSSFEPLPDTLCHLMAVKYVTVLSLTVFTVWAALGRPSQGSVSISLKQGDKKSCEIYKRCLIWSSKS